MRRNAMDRTRNRTKGFFLLLLILITTCAAGVVALLLSENPGLWLVTLGPLLLVEVAIYNYCRYWIRKRSSVTRNIPGTIALGTVIGMYAIAVLIIFVLFVQLISVSLSVYMMIHLVTAAAGAVLYGLVWGFNYYVEKQEKDVSSRTYAFKQILHNLTALKQELTNESQETTQTLVNELRALEEKMRYSDPFSHPSLRILEDNLQWQVDELVKCIQGRGESPGNIELSSMLIQDISKDLSERNGKLHNLRLKVR
jgi:hypothetical protein